MGKIASKCCKAFDGGKEDGEQSLDSNLAISQGGSLSQDNTKRVDVNNNEVNTFSNRVKATNQIALNSFIEKNNRK